MEDRVFQGMEYVYEVYQSGSFRQAADNLYVSQPSISASVRRIEERLGVTLFDRSAKPLKLTQCGQKYIEAVEQIQILEKDFVEYVNDWNGLRRGSLVLGGSALFSSLVLPHMISKFRKSFPHVQIELIEKTTANLEYFLAKGSIDMVMDYQLPHWEQYQSTTLFVEHFLLAVPKSNPVNAALKSYRVEAKRILSGEAAIDGVPAVPLERFRNEPFILMKSENNSRRRANELCEAAGFQPKVLLEFDQQMTNYLVAASGMGLCFTSSTLVRLLEPSPDMVYYRVAGPQSKREICLFWRQGRYLTRAMEEFRLIASGAESPL